MNKSKFLRVACPKCGFNQIVFGKASTQVKCNQCNTLLMRPTGGKTKIRAQIKSVLRVLWK